MHNMNHMLNCLAEARQRYAGAKQDYDKAYQAWLDEHGQDLKDEVERAKDALDLVEAMTREWAIENYQEDPDA